MNTTYLMPQTPSVTPLKPTGRDFFDRMFDFAFPWKMLDAFNTDMPFERENAFIPSLDLTSNETEYTLTAEIPGVEKENVKLEVHDGLLSLRGEKLAEAKSDDDKEVVLERRFGSFERSMSLPEDADTEGITASHKDGILTVRIPRKAELKTSKNISIAGE